METDVFLKTIKEEILTHPVMTHRFWNRFEKGAFTMEGLKRFSLHYYLHVLQTRLYDAMVLARTPSEAIQAALASILWDEYGRGNPERTHPAQFRKFLCALDLQEHDWNTVTPLPEFEAYRDVHLRLCQDYDFHVGLGVVGLAMEYPIPFLYEKLVPGFRLHGISDDALEFFLEHMPIDEIHSSLMEAAIRPELESPEHQAFVREGARRSLDARYLLMEALDRITFL
ncbi:MAG TPA: iron-containing redox enzyme family protein [Nitrospiria bacterium]|nr:iron-containing redox enzyme family protein [Nitrospiria bacterium]